MKEKIIGTKEKEEKRTHYIPCLLNLRCRVFPCLTFHGLILFVNMLKKVGRIKLSSPCEREKYRKTHHVPHLLYSRRRAFLFLFSVVIFVIGLITMILVVRVEVHEFILFVRMSLMKTVGRVSLLYRRKKEKYLKKTHHIPPGRRAFPPLLLLAIVVFVIGLIRMIRLITMMILVTRIDVLSSHKLILFGSVNLLKKGRFMITIDVKGKDITTKQRNKIRNKHAQKMKQNEKNSLHSPRPAPSLSQMPDPDPSSTLSTSSLVSQNVRASAPFSSHFCNNFEGEGRRGSAVNPRDPMALGPVDPGLIPIPEPMRKPPEAVACPWLCTKSEPEPRPSCTASPKPKPKSSSKSIPIPPNGGLPLYFGNEAVKHSNSSRRVFGRKKPESAWDWLSVFLL
jgi:hypothetical protein